MVPFTQKSFFENTDYSRTDFMKRGFIQIRSVFTREACEQAVENILDFENNLINSNTVELVTEEIDGKVFTKYLQGAYMLGDPVRKFFSSKLLSIGSTLLGGEDVYFSDLEAHIRNPGGGEIPKHQDNFYFNLMNAKGMTCYIALSKQDISSGGLSYIEKSHESVLDHSQSLCPGFSSSLDSYPLASVKKRRVCHPIYEVGDVTIHHPNNIHFSEPTQKSAPRAYALSARIFSTSEVRDPSGIERYQKLLLKNRSTHE